MKLYYIYQMFWREVDLWRCRSAPGAPGCGGAPGLAGWLHSSPHCWRDEYEAPQEQSVSVVLRGKVNVREQWKISLTYRMFVVKCTTVGTHLLGR